MSKTYLRSKLGTRIALLFVLCASVPLILLSAVAYHMVVGNLKEQVKSRLRSESKATSMAIVERLTLVEREVAMLAVMISGGHDISALLHAAADLEQSRESLTSISVFLPGAERQDLYGPPTAQPDLTDEAIKHLQGGQSLVFDGGMSGHGRHIFMARALDPKDLNGGLLCARINPDYIWGGLSDYKPAEISQLCVFDESNQLLYSLAPATTDFLSKLGKELMSSTREVFELNDHGRAHYVGVWPAFPKQFAIPKWTVVLAQGRDSVMIPVAPFAKQFPLLGLLSFWVALFLTLVEIRRLLIPLRKLSAGTQQIASRQFDNRVEVDTGDELEELADSFNSMAHTLGRQFNTLTAISEIDRALLSALDFDEIVKRALVGLTHIFPARVVAMTVVESAGSRQARTYVLHPGDTEPVSENIGELLAGDTVRLANKPEGEELRVDRGLPGFLSPIRPAGLVAVQVVPILVDSRIEGLVSLGLASERSTTDEATHLRQVADQVALAMANASLVSELKGMNWGIVRALARAVDAKSPWTLGHTECVTQIGIMIAREMGYSRRQLEDLERGTLLHDVGKIGIPAAILDKPGALTDEERMLIRQHPRIGRRIVEPINANADIISIVSQHHERYDGKGYPLGLSGDSISLSARIIAVADVADAIGADRPYRKGMPYEKMLAIIESDAGKAFDPKVVGAFLKLARSSENMESLLNEAQNMEPMIATV
ncbi:MAG: HD domain-containing protein [Verrucomicrobia bacterium]|nr:HD domain-containing protein [Verrucomicrobiota bacterium]